MRYQPPINGDTGDANRPYINGDRQSGTEGSIPSAEAIEHPQREILAAILAAGLTPDAANLTQLSQAIALLSSATPIGFPAKWPAATPPSGWLERDGSELSRETYADLFAVIGTTHGAGDGVTTFKLPDDRGLFERNWDNGAGIDSGRVFGSYQGDDIKSHNHTYISSPGSNTISGGYDSGTGQGYNTTGSTGGAETRPKNRAYLPIIKY